MARIIAFFIALCIFVIAASVGIVAHLQFGVGVGMALLITSNVILAALILNFSAARRRERRHIAQRFDEVLEHFDATCDEIANTERRVAKLETMTPPERAKEVEPLIAEVEVLGAIVTQMAEQITENEARIVAMEARPPDVSQVQAGTVINPPETRAIAAPAVSPDDSATRRREAEQAHSERQRIAKDVGAALDAGRIEIHMQPIVSLPQRHVRYYEILTRLITEDGLFLYPETFLGAAEDAGHMPRIDRHVLQHAARIARRLAQRKRDIGLFCNLSGRSLVDSEYLLNFEEFLDHNKDLSGTLVFELRQKTVRGMGPLELESLSELRDMGCRFSLEHVNDLHIDFADLASRGFRFVKINGARLLDDEAPPRGDIHVADVADLGSRHGIEIIADRIEREAQVIGLLDYNIRYAQGELFSVPKPVRAEILSSLDETNPTSGAQSRRRAAG